MGLLAGVSYDPSTADTTHSTAALTAMTALDTTNLRLTFSAPANGVVMVRLKGQIHGAAGGARVLFGVLDGATIKGRMAPGSSGSNSNLATSQYVQEAVFLVTGLTPSQSYTWDAAMGVEVVQAATALKYGGPDNATGDDNWGAFQYEIWETANLLAGTLYDPATAVTKATTSLLAMTAFDTTNLRHTIIAPSSGRVFWRIMVPHHGNATAGVHMLGLLESSSVVARTGPLVTNSFTLSTGSSTIMHEATGVITGLTPSSSHTYDAAYGTEVVAGGGGFKYGGPDNTTTNDAFGGIAYEIWEA